MGSLSEDKDVIYNPWSECPTLVFAQSSTHTAFFFFWPQRDVFLDGVNLSPGRYDLGMWREGERPFRASCTP